MKPNVAQRQSRRRTATVLAWLILAVAPLGACRPQVDEAAIEATVAYRISGVLTETAQAGSARLASARNGTATPERKTVPLKVETPLRSPTPPPTATLLPTDTPFPTDTPPPSPTPLPEAVVGPAPLQVRAGPGEQFAVLWEPAAGQALDVIGEQGGCAWLWVGAESRAGWVRNEAGALILSTPCEEVPRGLWQPLTGYLKVSDDPGALGELTVENGTAEDAVAIVTVGQAPVVSAYIRAGESFTLQRIRDGSFDLYFATGSSWDGNDFTQLTARQKFDEQLSFETTASTYATWSVTLHAVAGGQATTSSVDESGFPATQ